MKKPLDRRVVLLMALGAALGIGILLLGRLQVGGRLKPFQNSAVAPEEFHAPESESSSNTPSVLAETPPGTSASAASGPTKALTVQSPGPRHKMSDMGASGPNGESRAPGLTEPQLKPATNPSRFVRARSNYKDWNQAESVGHGQRASEAASEDAVPDSEVQALEATVKSATRTFLAEQKELLRKLEDADESERAEIRQVLKQNQDAFLAQQNKLRDQLLQLRASKDAPRR